jgi:hypothetical protein
MNANANSRSNTPNLNPAGNQRPLHQNPNLKSRREVEQALALNNRNLDVTTSPVRPQPNGSPQGGQQ